MSVSLIKWTPSDISGVVCFSPKSLLVTMSLPLKKRPYKGPRSLPAKVARLERRVAKQKPDLNSFELYGTTPAGTTAGYNEWWLPILSTTMLTAYTSDFLVEQIKFRVIGNVANSVIDDCRVDIVCQAGTGTFTQPAGTQTTGHLDIKKIKTFSSNVLSWSTASPNKCVDESVRIGRIAKYDGSTLHKNQMYLVIRWRQANASGPSFDYGVQVLTREK